MKNSNLLLPDSNLVASQDIVAYYDSCQADYSIVWHLNTHLAMHYGYWDSGVKNLRGSLHKMNDVLAAYANISSKDIVLDAGCGVGGSSIYLARNYHCSVNGITLSEKQAAFATDKAENCGLSDRVHFHVADFTNTGFEDESFDVVWAVESVCHANEKADFLKEAFRILKKGGRLILADFFRNMEHPTEDENFWLDKWASTWAIPEFEYHESFKTKAENAGFKAVNTINITENILPSARRLFYCFVPGIVCDKVLRTLNRRNKVQKANVWSTYYQYKALKRNLWNYYIVQAEKI